MAKSKQKVGLDSAEAILSNKPSTFQQSKKKISQILVQDGERVKLLSLHLLRKSFFSDWYWHTVLSPAAFVLTNGKKVGLIKLLLQENLLDKLDEVEAEKAGNAEEEVNINHKFDKD